MKLTNRELNKKLNATTLRPRDIPRLVKNCEIRVVRARNKIINYRKEEKCFVTIKIKALVKSNKGEWLTLTQYGPRHIRNFIRRESIKINNEVSSWVRLWGFNSNVYLERIDIDMGSDRV